MQGYQTYSFCIMFVRLCLSALAQVCVGDREGMGIWACLCLNIYLISVALKPMHSFEYLSTFPVVDVVNVYV